MAIFIFIIGLCFGSFYLVLGLRLPKGKNVIIDRSKCDNCHHTLSFWDEIPVLSYIFLKGKCRYCKKKISILNPIIEIFVGSLFLFSYLYYGFSYNMYMFIVLSSLMTIIFISDFREYIINTSPIVVSSILIFILDLYYAGFKYALTYLLWGIVFFIIMYLIKYFGDHFFKKESMGGGDVRFAFIIGQSLGFRLGLCSLILSAFLALPYSLGVIALKKNNEVPFGPFLASSLLIVFVFSIKFIRLLDLIALSLF